MSYNVTIEILDRFSHRLHINTVINLSINLPAVYLIIFHSTKAMGSYKYYLLYSVVTTLIMDIHQSVFYGMYILLPSLVNCCSGYCRYFGMVWGPQVGFLVLNLNTSVMGLSLLILVGYRYFSIHGDLKWFHSKYSLLGMFIFGIIYCIPTLIALVIAMFNQSKEELLDLVNKEFPEYVSVVQMGICASIKTRSLAYFYIGVAAFQIGIMEVLGFYFAVKTGRVLKVIKTSLTEATYAAQKQFLISVWIQILIPVFTLVIPISAMMSLVILKIRYSGFVSEIAIHMMTLHAPLNGLSIILIIKPYRNTLKKFLFRKSPSTPVKPIAVTSTDIMLK